MNFLHIVSIICLALCLVIFFYLKWFIKKRTSYSGLEERQSELAQLIAEIDRITDRDSQLVEDRVNKLKVLLHEIDRRIALYEKDLDNLSQKEKSFQSEAPKIETLYTSLGRGIRAALTTQNEPIPQQPPAIQNIQPPVLPEPENNNSSLSVSGSKRQIRSSIDVLINEGLKPEEIALQLGISIAEVNLAINLRRNRNVN